MSISLPTVAPEKGWENRPDVVSSSSEDLNVDENNNDDKAFPDTPFSLTSLLYIMFLRAIYSVGPPQSKDGRCVRPLPEDDVSSSVDAFCVHNGINKRQWRRVTSSSEECKEQPQSTSSLNINSIQIKLPSLCATDDAAKPLIGCQREEKIDKINRCLEQQNIDLWDLRELALTRGGFVNGEIRRRVWHKLVGLDSAQIEKDSSRDPVDATGPSCSMDECEIGLIRRDVGRSVLFRYRKNRSSATTAIASKSLLVGTASSTPPPCSELSSDDDSDESTEDLGGSASLQRTTRATPQQRWDCHMAQQRWDSHVSQQKLDTQISQQRWDSQDALTSVIVSALSQKQSSSGRGTTGVAPECGRLYYYQGFHDVASVVLLNLKSPSLASAVLRRIARSHLEDAMQESFARVTALLDAVLLPLIQEVDEEMHDFLVYSELELSMVLTPWLITWFSHDIHDEEATSRLFDVFIVSHPLMPIFFAVALIVHPFNRQTIFSTECDPVMVHMAIKELLSGISSDWEERNSVGGGTENIITFQDLIDDAISLMRKVPPRSLLAIAKRYRRVMNLPNLKHTSIIAILKTPPAWSLAASAPQDTVQRRQKRSHRIVSNKSLLKSPTKSSRPGNVSSTDGKEHHERAKIASGIYLPMPREHGRSLDMIIAVGRILGALFTSTRRKRIEFRF